MKEQDLYKKLYKDPTLSSGVDCVICNKDIQLWELLYIGQGKYKHRKCIADFSKLLPKRKIDLSI